MPQPSELSQSTRIESATIEPTGDELAARLRFVVTRLARRLRQEGDGPASPTQLAALATIERAGPLTLGELAELERVQPPTITGAVARLEEQGLVAREIDERDRRVARVSLTTDGARLLARTRTRKTAYLQRRLGTLDAADRETLAAATAVLEQLL